MNAIDLGSVAFFIIYNVLILQLPLCLFSFSCVYPVAGE